MPASPVVLAHFPSVAEESAVLSYDQRRSRVQDAIQAGLRAAMPAPDPMHPVAECYAWIRDLYDDHAVFEHEGKLWSIPYALDASNAVALGEASEVVLAYTPAAEAVETLMEAAIEGDIVPLQEKALRKDGTAHIKVIQPGWGASGHYSEEVLKRDGATAFEAGTRMFWNHPTKTERTERPERDLRDLAAVLVSPARYEESGSAGPGLYAEARVFGPYREAVEEMASTGAFGVSIRTDGAMKAGEAQGRKGQIVERLIRTPHTSIDFVTTPGAGGQVLSLFESATGRNAPEYPKENAMEATQIQEAIEAATRPLQEANERAAAENARLHERLVLTEAREFVAQRLGTVRMPDITRSRLALQLSNTPVLTEARELDREKFGAAIDEAVKGELAYLAEVGQTGRITGMGATTTVATAEESSAQLADAFRAIGLPESTAKLAAAGR